MIYYRTYPCFCAPLTFLIAIVLLSIPPARAEWTQFGGERQDFKVAARGRARSWPPEGPPRHWSRQLGEGKSAPFGT